MPVFRRRARGDGKARITRTSWSGNLLPRTLGKAASAVAFAANRDDTSPYESQSRQAIVGDQVHSRGAGQGCSAPLGWRANALAPVSRSGIALAHPLHSPVMDLNEHGAACRCLLRIRENQGEPGMSDASFIARFLPQFPEWRERPGAADTAAIVELARQLHLAARAETFRDYDRVRAEHRAGRAVLVQTERVPEQLEPASPPRRFVMLLVAMSESDFTVWCPYPNGHSDTLPRAARVWWDRWQASGLVLFPAAAGVIA